MGYSFDADYTFASGGDSEGQGLQMNNIAAKSVSLPSVFLDVGAEEGISSNVRAKEVRKPEDTNQASAANVLVVTGGEEGSTDAPVASEGIMNPASDGRGGMTSASHGLLSAARCLRRGGARCRLRVACRRLSARPSVGAGEGAAASEAGGRGSGRAQCKVEAVQIRPGNG